MKTPSSPPDASDPPVVRFRRSPWIVLAKVLGATALLSVATWRYYATGSPAVAAIWCLAAFYILADGWWHYVTPLVEVRRGEVTVHHHYLRPIEKIMISKIVEVDVRERNLFVRISGRPAPVRVNLAKAADSDSLIKFLAESRAADLV